MTTQPKTEPSMPETSAPPADDREDGEGSPRGTVANWATLKSIWRDRDVLYAQSIKALTSEQIDCIRDGRLREVKDLPPEEQGRAGMAALAWYPPEHGQGTGDDRANRGLAGFR